MANQYQSVTLTYKYKNTPFKRTMAIDNVSMSAIELVDEKILAINQSLASGTAGGLSTFFISDDYDAAQSIGALEKISEAKIEITTETYIFGGE